MEIKEKINFVKKVFRKQDVRELEGILEYDGFTERIDPLTLPELDEADLGQFRLTAKYKDLQDVRRLVKKHGRPLTLLRSPDGITLNADLTDYIQPYEKGFVRGNQNGNLIAGYGVLEKIFITELEKLKRPHHFFFISKHQEGDNLATLLIAKGMNSPQNPAKCREGGLLNYFTIAMGTTLLMYGPPLFFLSNNTDLDEFLLNHFLETITVGVSIPLVSSYFLHKKIYGSANAGTYAKSKLFNSDYGWKSYKKFIKRC